MSERGSVSICVCVWRERERERETPQGWRQMGSPPPWGPHLQRMGRAMAVEFVNMYTLPTDYHNGNILQLLHYNYVQLLHYMQTSS